MITLKKLYLNMKDKTKDRDSNEYEDVNINIERKLTEKTNNNQEVRPSGATIKPGGP